MHLSVRRPLLLTALLLAAAPATLHAQARGSHDRYNVVSINPLGIVIGWASAEWEGRINNTVTGGVGASLTDLDEDRYISVDGTFRLYPGTALEGFAVGLSGGFTHARDDDRRTDGTALGLGVSLDYQWLLGEEQRFVTAVGIGAKRLYWLGGDFDDGSSVLPTARLSVGYAF